MGTLSEEARLWNTPAIDAYLLWRFTQGYLANHLEGDAPPGLLHFICTAILNDPELSSKIHGKTKGLPNFTRSLIDSKKRSNLLIEIHNRTKKLRHHTLQALDIATQKGLLFWDTQTGKIHPTNQLKATKSANKLSKEIKKQGKHAEILGKWFANHTVGEIASYLKVVF